MQVGPVETIAFSRSEEACLAEQRILLKELGDAVSAGESMRVDVHEDILHEVHNAQSREESADLGDENREDDELARLLMLESSRIRVSP